MQPKEHTATDQSRRRTDGAESSALTAPVAERRPVAIGGRGIAPSSMDELYRFAVAVSKSGLAPKGIETPEAIFVALEMGLEVGLPLMASLQNIAVINGRPTIWGDAQLAVVRGTGQLEILEEWYEENGKRLPRNPATFSDGTTAVCRVKRDGYEPAETGFSVADAKRANLWGKQGPWTQYPARMLRFRARSFALRDQFGDALRGLLTVEEVMDDPVETAVNVTPKVQRPIFLRTSDAPADPAAEPAPNDKQAPETEPDPAPADPAPAATSATPPAESPQSTLAGFVTAAGHNFDAFVAWAKDEGLLDGRVEPIGFDDLDAAFATRMVRAQKGVLSKLAAFAAKGGAR